MQKMKLATADTSTIRIPWLRKHALPFRLISVSIYYLIGITYYHITEDWTYVDSAFFVTSSVATIGYGDFHPSSDQGRLFTAFFILAGLIFVLTAVDDLARYIVLRAQNELMERVAPESTPMERCVKKLALSMSVLIVLACIGIGFYSTNEDWNPIQAFYWTVCTMTTVGYGDMNIHNSSTRLFSVFFIACCVVVYATTMYNIREYYRLSSQEVERQVDHSSLSSTTDGDIELNPLRNGSFDSTEDNSMTTTSSSGSSSGYDSHSAHTARYGTDTRGYHPLETELDVSNRSAHHTDRAGNAAHLVDTYSVAGSLMAHSKSFSTRVYNQLKLKARSIGSASSDSLSTLPVNKLASISAVNGDNAFDIEQGALQEGANEKVDATLHLLRLLESVSGDGGALAQDLALLRKKYELAVPHDERVAMTRKELADQCVMLGPDQNSPRSPMQSAR